MLNGERTLQKPTDPRNPGTDPLFGIDRQELARRVVASSEEDLRNDCTLSGHLVLGRERDLAVSYAPFDHVQTGARVVIAGITPGRQQAVGALCSFRDALLAGSEIAEAERVAKARASFAGRMRTNLAAMLDHIGVNGLLGIATCMSLFGEDAHLVHYTSVLRYPVFLRGGNYAGIPGIERSPLLSALARDTLGTEIPRLAKAIWIPLGDVPAGALFSVGSEHGLETARVLRGIPHASGANAERIAYFLGRKSRNELSRQTLPDVIDGNRERLVAHVAELARFPP